MEDTTRYNLKAGRYQDTQTGRFVAGRNIPDLTKFTGLFASMNVHLAQQASFVEMAYKSQVRIADQQEQQISLLERLIKLTDEANAVKTEEQERRDIKDKLEREEVLKRYRERDLDDDHGSSSRVGIVPAIGISDLTSGVGRLLAGAGLILASPVAGAFLSGMISQFATKLLDSNALSAVTKYIPKEWIASVSELNIGEKVKGSMATAMSFILFGPIGAIKTAVVGSLTNVIEELSGIEFSDTGQAAFSLLMGAAFFPGMLKSGFKLSAAMLKRGLISTVIRGAVLNPIAGLVIAAGVITYKMYENFKEEMARIEEKNKRLKEIGIELDKKVAELEGQSVVPHTGVTTGQSLGAIDKMAGGREAIDNAILKAEQGDASDLNKLIAQGQQQILSEELLPAFTSELRGALSALTEVGGMTSPNLDKVVSILSAIKDSPHASLQQLYKEGINTLQDNIFKGISLNDARVLGSESGMDKAAIDRLQDVFSLFDSSIKPRIVTEVPDSNKMNKKVETVETTAPKSGAGGGNILSFGGNIRHGDTNKGGDTIYNITTLNDPTRSLRFNSAAR